MGGAVFTATLGAAGSVSDYNAKSGETRDLRQVQLRCGMRVQLPGYDRLPSALGTLAYCGPEKVTRAPDFNRVLQELLVRTSHSRPMFPLFDRFVANIGNWWSG